MGHTSYSPLLPRLSIDPVHNPSLSQLNSPATRFCTHKVEVIACRVDYPVSFVENSPGIRAVHPDIDNGLLAERGHRAVVQHLIDQPAALTRSQRKSDHFLPDDRGLASLDESPVRVPREVVEAVEKCPSSLFEPSSGRAILGLCKY